MRATIRRKLQTAAQVLEFVQAHPDADPSYVAVASRLKDAVAQSESAAIQQRDGTTGERATSAQRGTIRRQLQERLRHLARVASNALVDHPDWQGAFDLPRPGGSNLTFITAARSMFATAQSEEAALVALGLGTSFVEDVRKAIAIFDDRTHGNRVGKLSHVGASADLSEIASDCMHLIRVLDGLNRMKIRGDAELWAAWKSASSVSGPRSKARPADPRDVPGSAPPSEIAGKAA